MNPYNLIIPVFRTLLSLSRGRGEHFLAKIDAILYPFPRIVSLENQEITLYIPPNAHFFRFLIQTHENHIKNVIYKIVSDGDTFVDIGANIGYFSAHAIAAVGRTGQVFCFEPESENFNILNKNCEIFQRKGYHCKAFPLAVSSNNGFAILNIHRYSTYHAIESKHHKLDRVERQQGIETISLDSWAYSQCVNNIKLLKIDTEGHELDVLEGARGLFQEKRIEYSILECRDKYVATHIDDFCYENKLNQFVWDGKFWQKSLIHKVEKATDCLITHNNTNLELFLN
jgi:FkbM family methyltransferase